MATTPEGRVKKRIREVLNRIGCYYVMPATGGYGKSGVPDFLICYQGRFIGIEAKAGPGKTTALQDANLDAIADNGGIALVINETNIDGLEVAIRVWGKVK